MGWSYECEFIWMSFFTTVACETICVGRFYMNSKGALHLRIISHMCSHIGALNFVRTLNLQKYTSLSSIWISEKWVCLVGNLLVALPRILCTILEPPKAHRGPETKMSWKYDWNWLPYIFLINGGLWAPGPAHEIWHIGVYMNMAGSRAHALDPLRNLK